MSTTLPPEPRPANAMAPAPSSRRSDVRLVHVTPAPIFAWLKRLHDRMVRRVVVLGRVLVLARVAAADVAALQTDAEMHPAIAGLQAIFAAVRAGGDVVNRVEMRAGCHRHVKTPRWVVHWNHNAPITVGARPPDGDVPASAGASMNFPRLPVLVMESNGLLIMRKLHPGILTSKNLLVFVARAMA